MKNPNYLKTLGLLLLAFPTQGNAATLISNYTRGAGTSQLLMANGGAGTTRFVDTAVTGGSDLTFNGSGASASFVWSIDGSSLWSSGSTVNFTGLAIPLFSSSTSVTTDNTSNGTFTFTFYTAGSNNDWQGSNNFGTSDDSLIGSATASFTGGATDEYYVNFDSSIAWVANSSRIAVRVASTGSMRIKQGASDVPRESFTTGVDTTGSSFSLAGTVVPEPSAALLGALGALALLRRRR